MPGLLPTFPHAPQSEFAVTLADERFRVRFTWRERLNGWYFDLLAQDGTPIVCGRRIVAMGDPLGGLLPDGKPDGMFLIRGVNLTLREQLGVDVLPLFFPTDELPAESVLDEGFRIVVT